MKEGRSPAIFGAVFCAWLVSSCSADDDAPVGGTPDGGAGEANGGDGGAEGGMAGDDPGGSGGNAGSAGTTGTGGAGGDSGGGTGGAAGTGVELSPAVIEVLTNGGTGFLTVTIRAPAPNGGTVVELSAADPLVAYPPAEVLIPEGATSLSFRVRCVAATSSATTISATVGDVTDQVRVVAVTTAVTPALGDIRINEVNYDVSGGSINGGDANCDGTVDNSNDEFVELINMAAYPVDLSTVSIADSREARFTFPPGGLGPGEIVVVFGGAPGGAVGPPWCYGTGPNRLGDAAAVTGAVPLHYDNGGDTVSVRINGVDSDSTTCPPGRNASWTRSPDITGSFVVHSDAPGHAADRAFSPGTRLSGLPFSAADPP